MKTFSQLFAFAIIALGLSACGANNNNGLQYQNGQQGYYNQQGQWVQTGSGAQGGCVPLQSALTFSAQGPRISATDLLAGMLPANSRAPGQYGQVVMGGGVVQQQQYGYAGSMMLTKQSQNGTIQLQVTQGSVSGTLQLSPTITNQLMMMGGQTQQYPYNTGYNNSSVCVSSLAIDAVYSQGYNGQGYINQALVYLYLSNSQQPVGPIPLY
jgi:hypothetical protein